MLRRGTSPAAELGRAYAVPSAVALAAATDAARPVPLPDTCLLVCQFIWLRQHILVTLERVKNTRPREVAGREGAGISERTSREG